MTDATGDSAPLPAVPLPDGIAALPELGDGVVGTFVSDSAAKRLRLKGGAWSVLAVASIGLTWTNRDDLLSMLFGVALVVSTGLFAAGNLLRARQGDRPGLIVDAASVTCLLPLSRVSIQLDAVVQVRRLRRDLLVKAPGGITRRRRVTRERWASINHANTFEVSVDNLARYLSSRADAARPAR